MDKDRIAEAEQTLLEAARDFLGAHTHKVRTGRDDSYFTAARNRLRLALRAYDEAAEQA